MRAIRPVHLFVLFILAALPGCAGRKAAQVQFPQELFQGYIREGDNHAVKAHLWAWRKAEEQYRKAWALGQPPELLERRVINLALITTREQDELLAYESSRAELENLNPGTSLKLRLIRDVALSYGQSAAPTEAVLSATSPETLFDVQNSAVGAYLYLLYMRTFQSVKFPESLAKLQEQFKGSPLLDYLAPPDDISSVIGAHPEFAEMHAYLGHVLFSRSEVGKARDHLLRAVELLPDHTGCLNTLGNVYLFGIEDYTKAMEYYEAAYQIDPRSVEATFGRAVVLHYQGRYPESNRLLDDLLNSKPRWESLTDAQQTYYRAQTWYYKAYNAYLVGDTSQAREWVNTALGILPRFGGSHYLSGLLYYRARELDAAQRDFRALLDEGTSYCDASYYLGVIARPMDQPSASAYFLACADCYRKTLNDMKSRLANIPVMDITEAEKAGLKTKLESGIAEFAESSGKSLNEIMDLLPGMEFDGKDQQIELIKEVQEELASSAKPGQQGS